MTLTSSPLYLPFLICVGSILLFSRSLESNFYGEMLEQDTFWNASALYHLWDNWMSAQEGAFSFPVPPTKNRNHTP